MPLTMASRFVVVVSVALTATLSLMGASPKTRLATSQSGRAPAVQAVIDCRAIGDDAKRLACFDAAVAKMSAAEASGDLVTIDKEQRRAARRQVFGLSLPSLFFLDRGEKAEEVDKITVKIASAAQAGDGKWTIVLDDGAVWRQIDNNELNQPPHADSTAVIRRAALGSFFMNIDRQQAIRVHRIQ